MSETSEIFLKTKMVRKIYIRVIQVKSELNEQRFMNIHVVVFHRPNDVQVQYNFTHHCQWQDFVDCGTPEWCSER